MATTLSISAQELHAKQRIIWNITNPPLATLVKILIITNAITPATPICETEYPAVVNDVAVTTIDLDETILPLGIPTFVKLVLIYSDKTQIFSENTLLLILKTVPVIPFVSLSGANQNVRAEDASVFINLSQYSTKKSIKDGFSELTKVIAYISKVGGDNASDLLIIEKDVLKYDEWMNISNTLENDTIYEIAFKVRNPIGDSLLSNTINFIPRDTPSKIDHIIAFASLTNQKRKSATTFNDPNGDIILYWQKPDDYDFLKSTSTPVIKYIVIEQEYEDVIINGVINTIEKNEPSIIELLDNSSIQLLSSPEVIEDIYYHYRYIVPGSPNRLGRKFGYRAIPYNANGEGQVSNETSYVTLFAQPEKQLFSIINNFIPATRRDGTNYDSYDGSMRLSIPFNGLSSLKGALPFEQDNKQIMQLRIDDDNEGNNLLIFEGLIYLVFSVAATHLLNSENESSDVYTCDFSSVPVQGTKTLEDILEIGKTYKFILRRISRDPSHPLITYLSESHTIIRTKFKNGNKLTNIQNYPIYDNLTPVRINDGPGVRILFDKISPPDLNGSGSFIDDVQYIVIQDGTQLNPINQPNGDDPIAVYTGLPPSSGHLHQYSVSYTAYNSEIGKVVYGAESDLFAIESFGYPEPVLDAKIITEDDNKIKIEFIHQQESALAGSPSSTCNNRIIIMEDGANDPVIVIVVPHSLNSTYVSPLIPLITGKSYSLFIVAERVYTKSSHIIDAPNRFDGVLIRKNFFTHNFKMVGKPTVPRNIELFPSDKKLEILYDEPSLLNGVDPALLEYEFFMNKESTDFPFFNQNILQYPVAVISGSSIATLVKAFALKSNSNDIHNVVDLENDIEYSFSIRTKASVGGNNLIKTIYSYHENTGLINGNVVHNVIDLISNHVVPIRIVNGDMSPVYKTLIGRTPHEILGFLSYVSDNRLRLLFNRPNLDNVSDVIVTIDSNDGLDENNNSIDAFDTRPLRTVFKPNGLFNLEKFALAQSIATNAPDFVKYDFKIININGLLNYELAIPNLVNDRTYSITVRYIKNVVDQFSVGRDIFGPSTIINGTLDISPSIVQDVKFAVDTNTINLEWPILSAVTTPVSGGAGIENNSALKYCVKLYSNTNTNTILAVYDDITSPNFSISNLTNGLLYKVIIQAYYVRAGDNLKVFSAPVHANPLPGNLIRVNPRPLGPILDIIVGTPNTINGTITLPGNFETANYPILRHEVYVRQKANPAKRVLVQVFAPESTIGVGKPNGAAHPSGLLYTVNQLIPGSVINLHAINSFTVLGLAASFNTIEHQNPLNGSPYEVLVETVPTYNYAQAAPAIIEDATPYGNLVITSALPKQGTNGKIFIIDCNLNGTGDIETIVVLAKSSNSILVKNLSHRTPDNPLPHIVTSAELDNSSNFVAPNQKVKFEIDFAVANDPVTDLLVVVLTKNGSHTFVFPDAGSLFC